MSTAGDSFPIPANEAEAVIVDAGCDLHARRFVYGRALHGEVDARCSVPSKRWKRWTPRLVTGGAGRGHRRLSDSGPTTRRCRLDVCVRNAFHPESHLLVHAEYASLLAPLVLPDPEFCLVIVHGRLR
jgi:hypothetical protein